MSELFFCCMSRVRCGLFGLLQVGFTDSLVSVYSCQIIIEYLLPNYSRVEQLRKGRKRVIVTWVADTFQQFTGLLVAYSVESSSIRG